jgi:hypothetical protein
MDFLSIMLGGSLHLLTLPIIVLYHALVPLTLVSLAFILMANMSVLVANMAIFFIKGRISSDPSSEQAGSNPISARPSSSSPSMRILRSSVALRKIVK